MASSSNQECSAPAWELNPHDLTIYQWEIERTGWIARQFRGLEGEPPATTSAWVRWKLRIVGLWLLTCSLILLAGAAFVIFSVLEFLILCLFSTFRLTSIVLTSFLVVICSVSLIIVTYNRLRGHESIRRQKHVLDLMWMFLLFFLTALVAFLVARLETPDDPPLSNWLWYFVNVLFYGKLEGLLGRLTTISPQHAWASVLFSSLSLFVSYGLVAVMWAVAVQLLFWKSEFVGTPVDLIGTLQNPAYWFSKPIVRPVGRMIAFDAPGEFAGHAPTVILPDKMPGIVSFLKELWRYLSLPSARFLLTCLNLACGQRTPAALKLVRRRVLLQRESSTWFASHYPPTTVRVSFFPEMTEMIEYGTKHIPHAGDGVLLVISNRDFFGADIELTLRNGNATGGKAEYFWQPLPGKELSGSMTATVLAGFLSPAGSNLVPPKRLYIQALPLPFSRRDPLEISASRTSRGA